jgi:hypothetical protein
MAPYRRTFSTFQPSDWIIAVTGIAAVLAVLFIGNRTSETARLEQAAASSAAATTGSGTGADTATQTAPADSARAGGGPGYPTLQGAPGK